MKPFSRSLAALSVLFAIAAPSRAFAVTEAEAVAGRDIVKKNGDAIMTIELVVVTNSGGRGPTETKREVSGTVISSSGLVVTSLALIDPRAGGGGSGRGGRGGSGAETEFKEVKYRMPDNSEVPAWVVLKDNDLDLAFIAPQASTGPQASNYAFVNLDQPGEAQVLGTYFDMTRIEKALQRIPAIQTVTVIGIVEKPRRLIVMSDDSLGCPVFDMQGRPLGISLVYFYNGGAIRSVVVPAKDVAEMAKQAATARIEQKPDALNIDAVTK